MDSDRVTFLTLERQKKSAQVETISWYSGHKMLCTFSNCDAERKKNRWQKECLHGQLNSGRVFVHFEIRLNGMECCLLKTSKSHMKTLAPKMEIWMQDAEKPCSRWSYNPKIFHNFPTSTISNWYSDMSTSRHTSGDRFELNSNGQPELKCLTDCANHKSYAFVFWLLTLLISREHNVK